MRENPLLADPPQLGGVPDFAKIRPADYRPAFERAFAEHIAEIAAIRESTEPPTFENTIAAMERSGWLLFDVSQTFFAVRSSAADDCIREVDAWVSPRLATHYDSITSDSALFRRIEQVWQQRSALVDGEDRRIVDRLRVAFIRAGANLRGADQRRFQWLNVRLAEIASLFDQRLSEERGTQALVVESEEFLQGLTSDEIQASRAAAERREEHGYLLELAPQVTQPVLAHLERRASRNRVYQASVYRGLLSGPLDRRPLVLEAVRLRAERAELLGYRSHADYVIADETAGDVDHVLFQLRDLTDAVLKAARRDRYKLAQASELEEGRLALFDWPYVVQQQRRASDGLITHKRAELDRVLRDGVFFSARSLFGLTFRETADVRGCHDDVRFFEVLEADGKRLGMFGLDPFARESKRGGAWTQAIVCNSTLRSTPTVVISSLNVVRPADDEPARLSVDDVRTLFHEFGHALHALFVTTKYPRFAGLNVPRDFVEFPSQVYEMWAEWPSVVANYAEPTPTGARGVAPGDDFVRAHSFELLEQLAATHIDLAWHSLSREEAEAVEDVEAFEKAALTQAGFAPDEVAPRYTSTLFRHIFAGAYSARYYAYLWSEVLDADARDWFATGGGLMRELGDRFRFEVLAVGGTADSLASYEAFRGRPASVEGLVRKLKLHGG